MEFSDTALILQLGTFREVDIWVRLLSPHRGIFSAFAFGGSKSRRRFVGCLDVFNEVDVRVSEAVRTPYLSLREGVLLNGARRLRQDWHRYGLAVNCARFLQSFGVGGDGAAQSHFLMCQTLLLLENGQTVPRLLPLFFRLRLAFDQGYAICTSTCHRCGSTTLNSGAWFALREGRVLCRACSGRENGQLLFLCTESLLALEAVRLRPPSDWGEVNLSGRAVKMFAAVADDFIQYHVGITWERGRFVRS